MEPPGKRTRVCICVCCVCVHTRKALLLSAGLSPLLLQLWAKCGPEWALVGTPGPATLLSAARSRKVTHAGLGVTLGPSSPDMGAQWNQAVS